MMTHLSTQAARLVSQTSQQNINERLKKIWRIMCIAREAEEREAILFRQGMGTFHLPGAGHEAIALLADYLIEDDKIFPHYRDKALMLALGIPLYQLALDYFGKAESSSGGTQMASHFYSPRQGVMPCATPTALQALPAAGAAWGIKMKGTHNISVCNIGESASRQGEWFEALAFALQENLPLVLIVEDNGYGISTASDKMVQPVLQMIPKNRLHRVQSWQIAQLDKVFEYVTEAARNGNGTQVIWMECPRLMSHTSSDDHKVYRSAAELDNLHQHDPLFAFEQQNMSKYNFFSQEDISLIKEDIVDEVKETYAQASIANNPDYLTLADHTLGTLKPVNTLALPATQEWHMVGAVNYTLHQLMIQNQKIILFGEDIEDPKGGVFGLTKNLSTHFPKRVYNSPLAEATIAGVASGLVMEGFLPVFELQFIDFAGPAINQIMNQIATLRWRTAGKQPCPMVFIAPCGGYINGGGTWHSQTYEALFSYIPGIRVVMPSTPQDATNALVQAVAGEDPVLILLPKKQFFRLHKDASTQRYDQNETHILKEGKDITLLSWGNGVELCEEALSLLAQKGISCELLALQVLSPIKLDIIKNSILKTGNLIVVQEDSRHCSFGQAIIAELVSDVQIWDSLYAPPQLVSRRNTFIPFNQEAALFTLPGVEDICKTACSILFI